MLNKISFSGEPQLEAQYEKEDKFISAIKKGQKDTAALKGILLTYELWIENATPEEKKYMGADPAFKEFFHQNPEKIYEIMEKLQVYNSVELIDHSFEYKKVKNPNMPEVKCTIKYRCNSEFKFLEVKGVEIDGKIYIFKPRLR